MTHPNHSNERGNVLFLILIAVALFAALSYAVTSSTRSGGGDASAEQVRLAYTKLESYTTALRSAATRMIVSGVSVNEINNFTPSQFGTLSPAQIRSNIYHPDGGGVPYDAMRDPLITSAHPSDIYFTLQVDNVGTTSGTSAGNEILFAVAVTDQLCNYINSRFGYTGAIPDGGGFIDDSSGYDSLNGSGPATRRVVADYGLPATFSGRTEACAFDAADGNNYYYATIIER